MCFGKLAVFRLSNFYIVAGFQIGMSTIDIFYLVISNFQPIKNFDNAWHFAANFTNFSLRIVPTKRNTKQHKKFSFIYIKEFFNFFLRLSKAIISGRAERRAERFTRFNIRTQGRRNKWSKTYKTVLFKNVCGQFTFYQILQAFNIRQIVGIGIPFTKCCKHIFPCGQSTYRPLIVKQTVKSENFNLDRNIGQADNAISVFTINKITMSHNSTIKSIADTFANLLGTRGQFFTRNTDNAEGFFKIGGNVLASIKIDNVSVTVAWNINDSIH